MKIATDTLTYAELNDIEQAIYDIGQRTSREYIKTVWNMGDVVTASKFAKIENELSYYNTLYGLGYTMKDWTAYSISARTIYYTDINRWLEIIDKLQGIIIQYAGNIRTSENIVEIINKEV